MFFVEFHGAAADEMPPMFIARPREVAAHLKKGRNGHGGTCLHIARHYRKGIAKGATDRIPKSWRCSPSRMRSV